MSVYTVVSIILMIAGAVMSGIHDLQFSLVGYLWVSLNCLLTASYILYMRYASTSIKLTKVGMVYYNNVLSCVVLFPLFLLSGDYAALSNPMIFTASFVNCNLVAGVVGVSLNFCSLWCIGATTATTYAIVGSLCKIPVTVLGFVLFRVPVTKEGMAFVTLGTLGGLCYGWSKLPSNK